MSNIKCPQCSLVNWATDVECRKCQYLLQAQDTQDYSKPRNDPSLSLETQPLFSGVIKVLTAIFALGIVVTFTTMVFHLLDQDTTNGIGVIFMLGGFGLCFLAHIWLIVRIFEQSVWWGLGSFFIPLVGLFAVAKFWEKTKRSFVGQFLCIGIAFVGYLMLDRP